MSRERRQREELVRLVVGPDGQLHVDYRARLSGRGAWVEPTREAVEELEQKPGLLRRSLHSQPDTVGLLSKVQAANEKAVMDALTLCQRAGALRGGKDGVRGALASGAAVALVLARDTSPRIAEDLTRRAKDLPVAVLELDTVELGTRVGKGPRAALAVLASKPGRHLMRELRRYTALR